MKTITADQLRKLWTCARRAGFDHDDVHGMLPAGVLSTRDLSTIQAAVLIDAIKQGQSPDYARTPTVPDGKRNRRPRGIIALVSEEQRNTIEALRVECGFSEEGFNEWLSKRHYKDGRPMSELVTARDGMEQIELLKQVKLKKEKADARRLATENH